MSKLLGIATALLVGGAIAIVPAVAAASPNPSTTQNTLSGVSASSATNAWAVGNYINSAGVNNTLAIHWNGAKWVKSPTPNPDPSQGNYLNGVSVQSTTDAWAVGSYTANASPFPSEFLILHWNGTKWSKVASPLPSSATGSLVGVSGNSANDIWAWGSYQNGSTSGLLTLHWNGTTWTQEAVPEPNVNFTSLTGVAAISATNAWASGDYYDTTNQVYDNLVWHWNGTSWSEVTVPNPVPNGENHLFAIAAGSKNDVWAVGATCPTVTAQCAFTGESTEVLHWNGVSWSQVTSPDPGSYQNSVSSVSVTGTSGAWAVGQYSNSRGSSETLILQWNGTGWSQVTSPDPSTSSNALDGVTSPASNGAFAVGGYYNTTKSALDTLALGWNGTSWSQS